MAVVHEVCVLCVSVVCVEMPCILCSEEVVHGYRSWSVSGNTRGLLIAGILECKGEQVLIGVVIVLGVCAMGNTRGLLIAGIPGHNGATGNTVVLVPCSISDTLTPCTTWAYVGGGRALKMAYNDTCTSPSVTYGTNVLCVTPTKCWRSPSEAVRMETDWAAGLFLSLQFLMGVIVPSLSVASR